MSSTLQIHLFNQFSVSYNDRPVTSINTARSQALLSYLVLHRHTPQLRQRIAFRLWPNATDTQARASLRKELSYLRRDLPDADQFLLIDAKTLQWSPTAPFSLDVIDFEEAVREAEAMPRLARTHLEQAVTLYRGDLLPDCEDEWIVPERERLQQMQIRALEHLTNLLKDQQDYRTAIGYAQQLLRIDPLNEATYTSLMQLHGLSGDRANALQVYHRCMTTLREELGVAPSTATRKLYEQLLVEDGDIPALQPAQLRSAPSLVLAAPKLASTPLVGRQREWGLIQQWADSASVAADATTTDATTEVLLLIGEPGIGKTRLLEELRDTMQMARRVLWGRGFAAEMMRPYGIWIDALRSTTLASTVPLPPELGFLLPESSQPATTRPDLLEAGLRERGHLFDAVVNLFAGWANQAPLVVILDDLQWIDEASSALLHYAIRLLGHLPVLFACTGRSQELAENVAVSQVMQALRREQRLRLIEVPPLDREETAELMSSVQAVQAVQAVQTLVPVLSQDDIERVFIDSGGNPLFVLEVARARSHTPFAYAETLEALIGDRLQHLSHAAREFLPWAAALGRSFKPTMVAQVVDYPLPHLLTVIEQLERQMIIRPGASLEDKQSYDFAHDIVRQVVYQQLSEPRRRLVHLQIAHKLHQLSTQFPSDQPFSDQPFSDQPCLGNSLAGDIAHHVAHHASLAGDHRLAASSALTAAERCLKLLAYTEATKLAQQGIHHCPLLDVRTRIRVHLGLLRVCAIAGVKSDRVAQLEADTHRLMSEASQWGLKDEEAVGLETLGILHFNQNNFVSVHQHSLQAVEMSRVASPATAARLLAYSGSCLAEIGRDMVRAEALLLEAQSLAGRVGLELCDIYSGLGSVYAHNGRYAEARTLLHQAWQMSRIEQDHWREFTFLSYLAMIELEVNDPAAAVPYCHEMATVAAKIKGEGSEAKVAEALEALAHYTVQPTSPDADLERVIVTLQQVDAKRMLSYVLIGAAEVDLQREQPALAMLRAETALQSAQIIHHPSEIALAWAIAIQAAIASGESARAITQFEELRDQIERPALSQRAKTAVDQMLQQIQKFKAPKI